MRSKCDAFISAPVCPLSSMGLSRSAFFSAYFTVYMPVLKWMCGAAGLFSTQSFVGRFHLTTKISEIFFERLKVLFYFLCQLPCFRPERRVCACVLIVRLLDAEGALTIPSYLSQGARDLIRQMLIVDSMKRIRISEIRSAPRLRVVVVGHRKDRHIEKTSRRCHYVFQESTQRWRRRSRAREMFIATYQQ